MRAADKITLLRILLVFPIVYLVLLRANPLVPIALFLLFIVLDGLDGFAAVSEASKGSIGFIDYMRYTLGGKWKLRAIRELKASIGESARHGPRFDVAGDRIIEYSLWGLFVYTHIVPLFVLILIIIRHSVADALMGARGTSSKMRTKFARLVYSSNLFGRAGVNVVKFTTFSYLMLVYDLGYPITLGYALVAVLVAYIMLRGAAEIYEALA